MCPAAPYRSGRPLPRIAAVPAPRAWPSLVAATVLLLLGALVAVGIGDALGLSFTPSNAPERAALTGAIPALEPAPTITRIDIPDDERLELAATAVADALVARGREKPTVRPGIAAPDLTVRVKESPDDESYRIDRDGPATRSRVMEWPGRPPDCTRWPTGSAPAPRSRVRASRGWACGSPTPVGRPRARPGRVRRRHRLLAQHRRGRRAPLLPAAPWVDAGRRRPDRRAVPAVRRPLAARRATTASSSPASWST